MTRQNVNQRDTSRYFKTSEGTNPSEGEPIQAAGRTALLWKRAVKDQNINIDHLAAVRRRQTTSGQQTPDQMEFLDKHGSVVPQMTASITLNKSINLNGLLGKSAGKQQKHRNKSNTIRYQVD